MRLRFPSQYRDDETGLNFNYFRECDSTTGRYTQADPIGLSGGLNLHQYARGNSLRFVDPDGRKPLVIPAGIGGAILVGAAIACSAYSEEWIPTSILRRHSGR